MPPISSDTPRESLHALPRGTVLHDYVVESELGSGGFSIVYLARHRLNSDWLFAIKEYFPRELVARDNDGASVCAVNTEAEDAFEDGLRRFRDEAKQLRTFRNVLSVVSCLNYFEANGTAYLVMDYDDGLPLSEFLRRREAAGQPFTEADLRAVVDPLLEGLEVVHRAGVLHRDIKPGNIFVRRPDDITGRPALPVLIDFGAAKQNYLSRHSRSQAPYTPGYAAFEQVSSMGEMGPWSDIYAVGALMWRIIAGGCPGDQRLLVTEDSDGVSGTGTWSPTPREVEKRAYALHRERPDPMPSAMALGERRFSRDLLKTIDECIALYPDDRVQSCEKLRLLLEPPAQLSGGELNRGQTHADGRAPSPHGVSVPVAQTPASSPKHSRFDLAPGERFCDGDDCPEMVVIPAGRFLMGSPRFTEHVGLSFALGQKRNETPVHWVNISQSFALGIYPVTYSQWVSCVAAGGCSHLPRTELLGSSYDWRRADRPVVDVSWQDAQEYVAWLSEQTGAEYRLPSEAEWEYAARAETTTRYSWGDEIGWNRANCRGCGGPWDGKGPAPVGSFAPNAFGLFDMHGSVWEWVEDCWNSNYRGAPDDGNAWLRGNCARRVVRGGAWVTKPRALRSASRNWLTTVDNFGKRSNAVGFRVYTALTP